MNAKQKVPLIVALIPFVLLLGGAYLVFMFGKWIFSSKQSVDKHPETVPAVPERKPLPIPANPPGNTGNPPHYSAGIVAAPLPAVTPVYAAPASPKVTIPPPLIIPAVKTVPEIPLPARKIITREDMAKVFNGGARGITRMAAVSALKTLGFGKTAAYEALSPDGRFSACLKCSPDGIITWEE